MKHTLPRTSKKIPARLWIASFFMLLFSPSLPVAAVEVTSADFTTLIEKIWADKGWNPSASTISTYMSNMNSDGSFSDVDYSTYTSSSKTYMKTGSITHLDHLEAMAAAYVNSKNNNYGSSTLYDKIVLGLQYWYNTNPTYENWWYNQIAEPQRMGLIFVFMTKGTKQLPTTLANNTLARWKSDGGDPADWTGANQTDIALHHIYRACYIQDGDLLQKSLAYIFDPLAYTTEEGFQVDNSFFQHGYQIYIGGYGDALLAGVLPVANYVEGTAFQMTDAQRNVLCKFVRETFTDVIRGKTSNFDVMGRSISRMGALRKTSSWVSYVNQTKSLDPGNATTYDNIVKRIQGTVSASTYAPTKHTHYFRADYTLHMRPAYNFSVRTVSTRTERCEYGNGENEKGYFVADGCTDIARTGDEYYNIAPLWNWNYIPGTTAQEMTTTFPKEKSAWGLAGTSTFAGGVSDTLYGVTAYNYIETGSTTNLANTNKMNYRARKGWFFFDDQVVCLGAGITSSYRIYTTLDQCWGSNSVYVGKTDGSTKTYTGELDETTYVDTCRYVVHNNMGYYFPNGGRVVMSNKTKTGSWADINGNYDDESTGKVFMLQIDHQTPRNMVTASYIPKTKYAYIVYPNHTLAKMKTAIARADIDIAANSDTMQVVHHKGLGIYGMIFYRASEYKDDSIRVKVDRPCALLFKNLQSPALTFHVADPGQTKKAITVQVETKALGGLKEGVADYTGVDAQYAGQTRTITLTHDDYYTGISNAVANSETFELTCAPSAAHVGQPFTVNAEGLESGSAAVYSVTGVKMAAASLENGCATFALQQAGIYIVRVSANGVSKSTKIVVR